MTTNPAPHSVPLQQVPIGGIQPGGGVCFALERAWGRFRRACLRLFRSGYVRRMAAERQLNCSNRCPHDIIDSRDLKLVRNQCSCPFAAAHDPFRRPAWLPLARPGRIELLIFGGSFLLVSGLFAWLALAVHALFWPLSAVAFLLCAFVVSFFRDPERTIPTDPDALLSPADGTITHVEEVNEPDFPGGRAFRISMFLSVFNVHVNRLPRSGRVLGIRYFPGSFLDARAVDCAVANEQLWIDLGEGPVGHLVRIKQISGKIARRIVCWLRPGEIVKAGDRLGMIKFGSRTDVYVPIEVIEQVLVKVGDSARGGLTILARLRS